MYEINRTVTHLLLVTIISYTTFNLLFQHSVQLSNYHTSHQKLDQNHNEHPGIMTMLVPHTDGLISGLI